MIDQQDDAQGDDRYSGVLERELGKNRAKQGRDSRYQEGLSHLTSSLYTVDDIYGVVPDWSVRFKGVLKYLPGMRVSHS